ncbi:MAG TPA: TadE/TadG family type IV pilus assembly protein [Acidocella sp.]|nr:TadE/TadG family type IV pilus assembly protein [Acidocella sp.]
MIALLLTFFHACLHRLLQQRQAGIAMMTGLSLPFLIGAAGLTVDVGYWFTQRSALQMATDAGAMKAARDLQQNAATPLATLQADALAAANSASANQFALTNSNLSTTLSSTDNRAVQVSAAVPARTFFTRALGLSFFNIRATAMAGVAYADVSAQATCYAADDFASLYSTGFGTIDTSHASGIDSYMCGSTPPAPPAPYSSFCQPSLLLNLTCSLLNIVLPSNGFASFLLPFAFQIEPSGVGSTSGLGLVLTNVVQTLNLLAATSPASGSAVSYTQGNCPNTCYIPAGVYVGGITIGPGVNFAFTPSGGSHVFEIINGNLIISTQASLSAATDTSAIFYMTGATPGAVIQETQLLFNTAPIKQGSMIMTSTANFSSSSIIGIQTSAPSSVMGYAEQQETNSGLLSLLGLPLGNLLGTNFMAATGVCAMANATCSAPQNENAQSMTNLLTSLLSSVTGLLNFLGLNSESLISQDVTASGLTLANGTPTDWSQNESTNASLTIYINLLLLKLPLGSIAVNPTSSASGVVSGQSSNGAPSCTGQSLYSATITPNYIVNFTNILNSSGSGGANGTQQVTTDNIKICGTESSLNGSTVTIAPLKTNQTIVRTTSSGSSTLELLQ